MTDCETPIKSYGKAELAKLYFPRLNAHTALRTLHRHMTKCDGLLPALQRTGYRRCERTFTRYQVKIIFDYLGEP